jgi:hypothetical protein
MLLLACASGCGQNSSYLLDFYAVDRPSPSLFYVCHGYSCRYQVEVQLSQSEWQAITAVFDGTATTATIERERIGQAIALFEQQVGNIAGLSKDLPRSPAMKVPYGQQDCIDETVNTTTYLRIFQAAKLMRWHKLSDPARRGNLVDRRWPHNTATIIELSSGQRFAIDSWPRSNGESPDIITLNQWLLGGRHHAAEI